MVMPNVVVRVVFVLCVITGARVYGLSSAEQAAALNAHNDYRSTVAKGTAQNVSGLMPAGSNLYQLKYDATVESGAQSWADQCSMAHSTASQRNNNGENLFMSSDASLSKTNALLQAAQMWWAELKQYGIQSSLVLDSAQFNKGIGHWSQMAWAATAQLGCGVASCPSSTWKTYVVCRYSPSGNYLNQVVYKKSSAASACPSGSSANATSGLCVVA